MERFCFRYKSNAIGLDVPESVYYPDDDSILMANALLSMKQELGKKSLLEMGCGSGFLSILAAKFGAVVTAADINPEAILAAERNARANKAIVKAIESDLFSDIKGSFDFIIFNAPYLPDHDNGIAGREQWSLHQNGNVMEKFIIQSKGHLNTNGKLLMLFSSISGDVLSLLEKNGFTHKIIAKKKLDFEELLAVEAKIK